MDILTVIKKINYVKVLFIYCNSMLIRVLIYNIKYLYIYLNIFIYIISTINQYFMLSKEMSSEKEKNKI